MKFQTSIVTLGLAVFATTTTTTTSNAAEVEENRALLRGRELTPTTRIIGGDPVSSNEFPWYASLQDDNFGPFCGGSLITGNYVLTAAHCVQDSVDKVVLGTSDLTDTNSETRVDVRVKQIVKHPHYNSRTLENDIAILELAETVTTINPVSLAGDRSFSSPGTMLEVIGFGTTKVGGQMTTEMRGVDVPAVSYERCTAPGAYSPHDIHEETNICAGYVNGGMDSCQGDSGSSLFQNQASRTQVQVGVVSFGEGCGYRLKYGVYTRVSAYIDWIKQVVGVDASDLDVRFENPDDKDNDDGDDDEEKNDNEDDEDLDQDEVDRCGEATRKYECRRLHGCIFRPRLYQLGLTAHKCIPRPQGHPFF